ncbi:MAG: ArdC-like ssDNA-binding domain-containing protein [Candidatus Fimenecus sp.]
MINKIQDIFNWYENFTENTIVVNTDKISYEIGINKNQLPHLLGLQYANIKNSKQKNIRGIALYNYIKNNNLTDEYIYNEISKNQPEKLNAVKERVETFKYFMEHLEKGIVYQNMNSSSNIRSDEFIIETKNHRIMHLGLIDIGGESVFNNFEIENAEIRNLETYFTQRNTKYFQNSPIREKIISIERYTDDGSLEPFSFSNKSPEEQQNIINPQEVEAQNVSASFNLTEEAKTIKPQIKNFDREEFNKLIENIEDIEDIVKSYEQNQDLIAEYLAFRSNFYNYSVRNALLIHMQNPYSTFTASFTKWKDLGYSVKKGEKAIRILRPIEKIKYVKDGKTLTVNKNTPSEDKAKIASGEYPSEPYTTFAQAMVFDISQTDCPPEDYPKIFSRGTENADRAAVYECVKEYAQLTGFTVTEDDMTSISLGGYYQPSDDTIHINNTLKDDKKLSVLCHELAHGMLHKTSDKPTAVKEFEAESFAAMLQSKLGFLPSEANKEYIKQHYLKAKDLINPKETLKRTAKMFAAASSGITEIMKEKGLITENSRNINREEKITPSQAQDIKSNFMQAL